MVSVRWKDGENINEIPFERFFVEKSSSGGREYIKPFTPHFVYHGSGVLNPVSKGCLVCHQDCAGGLICNNQGPCVNPVPELKPEWDFIPEPGTNVTLVIYVMNDR
mgnify:CR=1 FL=1